MKIVETASERRNEISSLTCRQQQPLLHDHSLIKPFMTTDWTVRKLETELKKIELAADNAPVK